MEGTEWNEINNLGGLAFLLLVLNIFLFQQSIGIQYLAKWIRMEAISLFSSSLWHLHQADLLKTYAMST